MIILIFKTVAIMLVYMALGFVLCKSKKASVSHAKSISAFLVYILGPAMIINSFLNLEYSTENIIKLAKFFFITLAVQLIFFGILFLILHKKYDDSAYRIMTVGAVLGNVGFIGMPIISGVFPVDEGQIILDGLCGGNEAMPELADLGAIHSTRGYQPMSVTHYQADWCPAAQTGKAPVYPGTEWEGKIWNRDTLLEHYAPWKALSDKGVSVHVGEFGCYDKTDHATAMNWFNDLFSVYRELGWGFSLWNFIGEFGIIGHNRPGTIWENIKGFKVDRELYDLIKEYMK